MILQSELTTLDSEIAQLQALIESKRQQQEVLYSVENLASEALSRLTQTLFKIEEVAPAALASLKSAVLELFDGGDDWEPELIAFNGETGDYLLSDGSTSVDEDDLTDPPYPSFPHPHEAELNGRAYEWSSPFASPLACLVWKDAPLLGQACELTCHWEHDWELEPLNGQAWEIATPLCCPVEFADILSHPSAPTEMIHTSARTGYLKLRSDGRILAAYAWFSRKTDAAAWASDIEVIPNAKTEMRLSQRNSSWKWELKITGLNMTQIERLSKEDLSRKPYKDYASSIPPSYKEPERKLPVNPDEVGEGDIVTALLTPSASYKIIQIMPNGILDCENLTTGDRLGLRPTAVTLVQKGEESAA